MERSPTIKSNTKGGAMPSADDALDALDDVIAQANLAENHTSQHHNHNPRDLSHPNNPRHLDMPPELASFLQGKYRKKWGGG